MKAKQMWSRIFRRQLQEKPVKVTKSFESTCSNSSLDLLDYLLFLYLIVRSRQVITQDKFEFGSSFKDESQQRFVNLGGVL